MDVAGFLRTGRRKRGRDGGKVGRRRKEGRREGRKEGREGGREGGRRKGIDLSRLRTSAFFSFTPNTLG